MVAFDLNVKELHARLKKNDFEYIIIGRRDVNKLGLEAVNSKLESIGKSDLFKISYDIEDGAVIYKVL